VCGVVDGTMALVVWLVHRAAGSEREMLENIGLNL
jgi:hypothetical protein